MSSFPSHPTFPNPSCFHSNQSDHLLEGSYSKSQILSEIHPSWAQHSQLTNSLFCSLTILANAAAPWEKCLEYDVEFKGLKIINISVQGTERKTLVWPLPAARRANTSPQDVKTHSPKMWEHIHPKMWQHIYPRCEIPPKMWKHIHPSCGCEGAVPLSSPPQCSKGKAREERGES